MHVRTPLRAVATLATCAALLVNGAAPAHASVEPLLYGPANVTQLTTFTGDGNASMAMTSSTDFVIADTVTDPVSQAQFVSVRRVTVSGALVWSHNENVVPGVAQSSIGVGVLGNGNIAVGIVAHPADAAPRNFVTLIDGDGNDIGAPAEIAPGAAGSTFALTHFGVNATEVILGGIGAGHFGNNIATQGRDVVVVALDDTLSTKWTQLVATASDDDTIDMTVSQTLDDVAIASVSHTAKKGDLTYLTMIKASDGTPVWNVMLPKRDYSGGSMAILDHIGTDHLGRILISAIGGLQEMTLTGTPKPFHKIAAGVVVHDFAAGPHGFAVSGTTFADIYGVAAHGDLDSLTAEFNDAIGMEWLDIMGTPFVDTGNAIAWTGGGYEIAGTTNSAIGMGASADVNGDVFVANFPQTAPAAPAPLNVTFPRGTAVSATWSAPIDTTGLRTLGFWVRVVNVGTGVHVVEPAKLWTKTSWTYATKKLGHGTFRLEVTAVNNVGSSPVASTTFSI